MCDLRDQLHFDWSTYMFEIDLLCWFWTNLYQLIWTDLLGVPHKYNTSIKFLKVVQL